MAQEQLMSGSDRREGCRIRATMRYSPALIQGYDAFQTHLDFSRNVAALQKASKISASCRKRLPVSAYLVLSIGIDSARISLRLAPHRETRIPQVDGSYQRSSTNALELTRSDAKLFSHRSQKKRLKSSRGWAHKAGHLAASLNASFWLETPHSVLPQAFLEAGKGFHDLQMTRTSSRCRDASGDGLLETSKMRS